MVAGIPRIETHLEDRSYLTFIFYPRNGQQRLTLPFMENISISESQESNLAEYTPIGRPGSLFSYLGAKSKLISLSFNMTLPNILEHSKSFNIEYSTLKSNLEQIKDYFVGTESSKSSPQTTNSSETVIKDQRENYFRSLSELENTLSINTAIVKSSPAYANITVLQDDAIRKVLGWINLIRSSVLNNSSRPTEGPPIVRITHGVMFRDVPCVVKSYNIEQDESAGFDKQTLLPRILKCSMELQEVRLSEEDFKYKDTIRRDYLTGWESFIDRPIEGMDPGGVND